MKDSIDRGRKAKRLAPGRGFDPMQQGWEISEELVPDEDRHSAVHAVRTNWQEGSGEVAGDAGESVEDALMGAGDHPGR